jgi:hypothetical protein
VISHYWGAPGATLADRVRAVVAWAPLPGELIALGALAGAVAIGGTVLQATVLAVRGSADTSVETLDQQVHALG